MLGALEERSARAREQHHVGSDVGEHHDRSAGRVLHVGEACWRHSRQAHPREVDGGVVTEQARQIVLRRGVSGRHEHTDASSTRSSHAQIVPDRAAAVRLGPEQGDFSSTHDAVAVAERCTKGAQDLRALGDTTGLPLLTVGRDESVRHSCCEVARCRGGRTGRVTSGRVSEAMPCVVVHPPDESGSRHLVEGYDGGSHDSQRLVRGCDVDERGSQSDASTTTREHSRTRRHIVGSG